MRQVHPHATATTPSRTNAAAAVGRSGEELVEPRDCGLPSLRVRQLASGRRSEADYLAEGARMFESIEAYRQREVSELDELIRAGVESDASISENYSGIIARLRTLRHFSRDLPGLVEHAAGIANRNAVSMNVTGLQGQSRSTSAMRSTLGWISVLWSRTSTSIMKTRSTEQN